MLKLFIEIGRLVRRKQLIFVLPLHVAAHPAADYAMAKAMC